MQQMIPLLAYFNTTIVQLKGPERETTDWKRRYFNTTIVQLKENEIKGIIQPEYISILL